MTPPFARIAVLGTGLIGGSFALAARPLLPVARIIGWDAPDVLERALARGVIDEAHSDLREAVTGADLVYVALPVGAAIERLHEIAQYAAPGALVTDASSTKRAVCAAAEKSFSGAVRFLGGHPMAGNEVSGLDAADAGLFRGAPYALIALVDPRLPSPGMTGVTRARSEPLRVAPETGDFDAATDARITAFVSLLEAIGARPIWMDAAAHDRAVAIVSHLPQLLAIALGSLVHEEISCAGVQNDHAALPLALAGRGLRDALRLAGSPYRVWRDIVLTNTDNLDLALDRLGQAVEHLRASLRQRQLETQFAAANDVYKALRKMQ